MEIEEFNLVNEKIKVNKKIKAMVNRKTGKITYYNDKLLINIINNKNKNKK